jgi:hypothetical protein
MSSDYNADQSSVPYILPEFDFFWETTYNVTDSSFPSCALDRPPGGSSSTLMGIMNHMLHYELFGIQVPDAVDIDTTNSEDSINSQVQECVSTNGAKPRVVLVCFFLR